MGFKRFLLESPQNDSNLTMAAGVLVKTLAKMANGMDKKEWNRDHDGRYEFNTGSGVVIQYPFNDEHFSLTFMISGFVPFKNTNLTFKTTTLLFTVVPADEEPFVDHINRNLGVKNFILKKNSGYQMSVAGTKVQYIVASIDSVFLKFDTDMKPNHLAFYLESEKIKSVITHEFTHIYDSIRSKDKFTSKYMNKRIFAGQEDFDQKEYLNSNHEVNARYSQFGLEVISELSRYLRFKQGKFIEMFPTPKKFLDSFTVNDNRVRFALTAKILTGDNEKRVVRRITKLYDYLKDLKGKDLEDFVKNGKKSRMSAKYFNALDGMK